MKGHNGHYIYEKNMWYDTRLLECKKIQQYGLTLEKDDITCLGLDIELIIIAWYNELVHKNRMKEVFVVIE